MYLIEDFGEEAFYRHLPTSGGPPVQYVPQVSRAVSSRPTKVGLKVGVVDETSPGTRSAVSEITRKFLRRVPTTMRAGKSERLSAAASGADAALSDGGAVLAEVSGASRRTRELAEFCRARV